jgi:oligopeptide/dipeptide ABC transporter ATP-binding protein
VRRGEVLGVVGESGCGKTVTAQSILRIIPSPGRIDSGEILFHRPSASDSSNGHHLVDIAKVSSTGREIREIRGQDIAMIFQEPMSSFSPVHTIGSQIIEAILLHQSVTPEQARQQAIELLRLVGISGAEQRVDNYPHQFSGGMRQRAMIAVALSCNPSLLIADEPTTALDVTVQAQILDVIQDIQHRFHAGVVFITHDLGVVARIADRVQVMYAGRTVERGQVDDIFRHPTHPYTRGLLASLPALGRERLTPIPGAPPNMLRPPSGCAFRPRCPFAQEICAGEIPPLRPLLGLETACVRAEELLVTEGVA